MNKTPLEYGCLCGHFEKCDWCSQIDWLGNSVWATDGRYKWKCSEEFAASKGWEIIGETGESV
jgi:hypothetical protein